MVGRAKTVRQKKKEGTEFKGKQDFKPERLPARPKKLVEDVDNQDDESNEGDDGDEGDEGDEGDD